MKTRIITLVTIVAMLMAGISTPADAAWIYAIQTASLTMPGATTYYSGGVYRSPATSQTESAVQFDFQIATTVSNLYVRTTTAQPATGAVIITVRKNGTDDALTITIPAGAAAGVFTDNTNTVSFNAGETFSVSIVCTTPIGTVSAKISQIAVALS